MLIVAELWFDLKCSFNSLKQSACELQRLNKPERRNVILKATEQLHADPKSREVEDIDIQLWILNNIYVK